jgi:hypothetical protein
MFGDSLTTLGLMTTLISGLFTGQGAAQQRASVVAPKVIEQAQRFQVDPFLVAAIVSLENPLLDPYAESTAGAKGLMQVMPFWFNSPLVKVCGVDPHRDRTNLCLGVQVLQFHIRRAPTLHQALLDYSGCKRTPGCERYSGLVTQRQTALRHEFNVRRWGLQAQPRRTLFDTLARRETSVGSFTTPPFMLRNCQDGLAWRRTPTGVAPLRRRTLGCAPPQRRASLAKPF